MTPDGHKGTYRAGAVDRDRKGTRREEERGGGGGGRKRETGERNVKIYTAQRRAGAKRASLADTLKYMLIN